MNDCDRDSYQMDRAHREWSAGDRLGSILLHATQNVVERNDPSKKILVPNRRWNAGCIGTQIASRYADSGEIRSVYDARAIDNPMTTIANTLDARATTESVFAKPS